MKKAVKFLFYIVLVNVFSAHGNAQNNPNIIFILADDLSWIGTQIRMIDEREDAKSDWYETPNLLRLANEGMKFSNAYSPAPNCSPTRASFLTGKSPARTQMHTQMSWERTDKKFIHAPVLKMDAAHTTIAELIESIPDIDYETAVFGKWHVDLDGQTMNGEAHGFDEDDYLVTSEEMIKKYGGDPKHTFSISESTVKFMENSVAVQKPFFIYTSFHAVHLGIESLTETSNYYDSKEAGDVHNDAGFAAMTTDMDTGIGLILDAIEKLNIGDNTYVIFSSDNGGHSKFPTAPMRSTKRSLFGGGIRVPFVVKGPGIEQGVTNEQAISLYDLMPTIADMVTGSTDRVPHDTDGSSLLPTFLDKNTPIDRGDRGLYFYFPQKSKSNEHEGNPSAAIIKGDYKLHVQFETGQVRLFDVKANDIEEAHNIADEHPELVSRLRLELRDYLNKVNSFVLKLNPDPMYNPNPGPEGDVDNDGLDDGWEFRNLLSVHYTGEDDPDGDGYSNAQEAAGNMDPLVHDQALALTPDTQDPIQVTPNPVEDYLMIKRGNMKGTMNLSLYDVHGKEVNVKFYEEANQFSCYTGRLDPGLYIVRIETGNQKFSKKIVVN
jgi:arylsulfatase A-like enzyme